MSENRFPPGRGRFGKASGLFGPALFRKVIFMYEITITFKNGPALPEPILVDSYAEGLPGVFAYYIGNFMYLIPWGRILRIEVSDEATNP